MNLYAVRKYINYIFFSSHKRGHGIHSPFVFYLITKVFRNKIDQDLVLNIEKTRQMMISDRRRINVTDYGSGPDRISSSSRKVSEIVKYSAIPRKYGILLTALSREFGKSCIVELGTSLGISTLYLAAASRDVPIHTVEGCPEISKLAKENFKRWGLKNISLYTGRFDEVLAAIGKKDVRPGLVFIDGDHRKERVLSYFSKIAEMVDENGVIVLDDIHNSTEMGEAWNEIREYPGVTLTIDIFRMGLVFFRKGLTRSDFIIRY